MSSTAAMKLKKFSCCSAFKPRLQARKRKKEKSMKILSIIQVSSFLIGTQEILFGNFQTHIIEDYRPESKPELSKRKRTEISSHRLRAEGREDGSKYLPFQFVYKFLQLLPDTGYNANIRLSGKENFNFFKCLTHMREDRKFRPNRN